MLQSKLFISPPPAASESPVNTPTTQPITQPTYTTQPTSSTPPSVSSRPVQVASAVSSMRSVLEATPTQATAPRKTIEKKSSLTMVTKNVLTTISTH
jgi:hypothetical protein